MGTTLHRADVAHAWSRYWADGHTASCFAGAGAVAFDTLWRAAFDALPPGARVLDLATGAGDVALRAVAADRGFIVHGADIAEPPPGIDARGGVAWDYEVAIEALPYADAAFDAVVSQFGFEYADPASAAPQAARVLAPGGRTTLVLHAADGPVKADTRDRLDRIAPLLARTGLLRSVETLTAIEAGRRNPQLKTTHQRRAMAGFEAAQADARGRSHDDAVVQVMLAVGRLWSGRGRRTPDAALAEARALREAVEAYEVRLRSLLEAARSENDMRDLTRLFEANGLIDVGVERVRRGADALAWRLDARKPAP